MTPQAKTRTITGLAIVAALVFAFLLREITPYLFDFVLLGLLCMAVYEVSSARKAHSRGLHEYYIYVYIGLAYFAFLLGLLSAPKFSFIMHIGIQAILLFIFCIYTFFMYYVDNDFIKQAKLKKLNPTRECRRVVLEYLKILLYPAALIFALIPLNHIKDLAGAPAEVAESVEGIATAATLSGVNIGLFALLLVFVVSTFTDTFAYIVGSKIGGRKLCPKISPKKTWSGAVGGLFGGVLGALILLLIFCGNTAFTDYLTAKIGYATSVKLVVIGVSLVGSVLTQAGDIYASWFKRKCEIKDFGSYLPGHGGVMDRLDGIIFNGVFMFFMFFLLVFVI